MEQHHRRVPMEEIRETPAKGYYLPKNQLRSYALWAALGGLFLYFAGFFRGKGRH
ncbi:hypothetical protein H9X85_05205 [Anaerotignum lactatifermentans]|uniref:Uncharacterized protein n=1 Tax=Anaerotignum lactatifermentans TaxID=160404 RepID=A0ABS2G7V3_9FIRM|nr:hypothetical protein [Anaerotignum lactatifermentans]MBM6829155.1 hypothetical protein [Anaerotignum lactatifermentans]MBM6877237.1 hypothetical protein [Anaerotignum lactatifermentans]MBM6950610.1 hypothetical protein [Anaerotignum lactatifermentans]